MRQEGFYHSRLNILWTAYYFCVILLGVRLLYVQVLRNVYYARVAERNRTQSIYQTAPRGHIYDRHGDILATNRAAFSLIYVPGEKKTMSSLSDLASDLSHELRRAKDDLLEILQEAEREESAMPLAENLPPQTMFKLSEIKAIYPGVDLIVEARRYYPRGVFAGHLLGYMSKMDKRSWAELKNRGYRVDSRIGQSGLEKLFENELRGVDGEVRMEVDAQGRLKRILEHVPWKPGGNLHLTLDAKLQAVAEEALRQSPSKHGAAIALDPRTGAVLVLASEPTFDPNLFLLAEDERPDSLIQAIPEFNLAISGAYAPGSTFKIIVGAAMFNETRVSPKDRVFCPGYFWVGQRMFRCWEKEGHHYKDWMGGLTHSCDVYFYQMGLRTGADQIEKYEKAFRLGEKTGIALASEKTGNRFGPEAKKAKNKPWYDGDTVNLSIGQGELLVTPIQMATVIAAVANRGTLWRPYFVDRVEFPDGRPLYQRKPEIAARVELKADTWNLLHAALVNVVRGGTGRRVHIPGLLIGGKTGTTQNPQGEDHAWFVAYAGHEGEEASLAVSVLVQHGGQGSVAAGPIARAIIQAAFEKTLSPQILSTMPTTPMFKPRSQIAGP